MNDGGDTIRCSDLPWLSLADRVSVKVIKLVPETGGYSVIIKADEGGVLPRHRHLGPAEIFILKGAGNHPQTGAYAQGDYVSERDGAIHDALTFEEDTELLMISSGPSAFLTPSGDVMFMMDIPMLEELIRKELR